MREKVCAAARLRAEVLRTYVVADVGGTGVVVSEALPGGTLSDALYVPAPGGPSPAA